MKPSRSHRNMPRKSFKKKHETKVGSKPIVFSARDTDATKRKEKTTSFGFIEETKKKNKRVRTTNEPDFTNKRNKVMVQDSNLGHNKKTGNRSTEKFNKIDKAHQPRQHDMHRNKHKISQHVRPNCAVHKARKINCQKQRQTRANEKMRNTRRNNSSTFTDYELSLPPEENAAFYSAQHIPWFQAETQTPFSSSTQVFKHMTDHPNNSDRSPDQSLLPSLWYELENSTICRLNHEILSFCCYVSLSANEKEVRNHVVEELLDLVKKAFPSKSSDNTVSADIFGSFSCPQVCTFFSDVDIQLGGVVDETPLGHQFVAAASDFKSQTVIPNHIQVVENKAKQDKVAKWRQALMESDASTNQLNVSDIYSTSEPISSTDRQGATYNDVDIIDLTDDSAVPLFIIDRRATIQETHHQSMKSFDADDKPSLVVDDHESESENDSADPMEAYQNSSAAVASTKNPKSSYSFRRLKIPTNDTSKKDSASKIKGYPSADVGDPEISAVITNSTSVNKSPSSQKQTRKRVINALHRIKSKITRHISTWVQRETVHVRERAKVPIVSLNTKYGFESDILIRHGEVIDTSAYASSQVNRFHSFAPVVLILKTLLHQTGDLDKVFVGGIGSFKLYVLVSFHIEQHILHGGNDSPAEILLSFLLRFGRSPLHFKKLRHDAFTLLSQDSVVESDGGRAECQAIFKLEKCKALFSESFSRLLKRLSVISGNSRRSWLSCIIDALKLRVLRNSFLNKSSHAQHSS